MANFLALASDPTKTLNDFKLDDLAPYVRERSFPTGDSTDFRDRRVSRSLERDNRC